MLCYYPHTSIAIRSRIACRSSGVVFRSREHPTQGKSQAKARQPTMVGCLAEAKQRGISVGWMAGKGKKVPPEKIKALLDTVVGRLP